MNLTTSRKIKVAVLGASGIVGQVFCWLLSRHPFFELSVITASEKKTGLPFPEGTRWQLPVRMPEVLRTFPLSAMDPEHLKKEGIRIVFSALPSDIAADTEPYLRREGYFLFSNASALRDDAEVPILIPEVNPESLGWIEEQGFPRSGFVVTNANCSTTGLAMALGPLRQFEIENVFVSTYQSISGAGYPGIPSMDILSNALPFIRQEEEKVVNELRKILSIQARVFPYCVRIPVMFGHLETVWLKFKREVPMEEIRKAWAVCPHHASALPSSSKPALLYGEDDDFPQSKLAFTGQPPGMPVFLGRLKKKDDHIGFVLLVNNIVKGGAGGSVQNAEFFVSRYKDWL